MPTAVAAPSTDTHPEYRPDIDGLRAIAVLSVVGYHAFPATVTGGFIGVDIFFVISGYLISTIILKGLRRDRFSYLDFYVRRIKRIFPALMLLLILCLVFGWFVLYSDEYRDLGKQSAGGAGFVANILLWQESGYFDKSHQLKPFLHLWSLGIEEQYYLIWPLLLGLLWKGTHRSLPLILVMLLSSFLLNVSLVGAHPEATFYLPHTRFWELMVGSIVAYAALSRPDLMALRRPAAELCSWLGLALLVAALMVTNENSAFPGYLALLPTLGAACLICAGPHASVNRFLLGSRPFVFFGLISYPLYLWHWPLISFQYVLGNAPARGPRAIAALCGIGLAWLTYRFVERPVRTNKSATPALVLFCIGGAVLAAGIAIYAGGGLEFRAVNQAKRAEFKLLSDAAIANNDIHVKYWGTDCAQLGLNPTAASFCRTYGSGHVPIVIWGDSHAEAWAPVFDAIADEKDLRIILLAHPGCPPIMGVHRIDRAGQVARCTDFDSAQYIVRAIEKIQPQHVFMISFWSLYTHGPVIISEDPHSGDSQQARDAAIALMFDKTVHRLAQFTKVTIFRTMPVLRSPIPRGLLRNSPMEPATEDYQNYEAIPNQMFERVRQTLPLVDVFDPSKQLCERLCKAVLDGKLMYSDDNHISAQGALMYKNLISSTYFGADAAKAN